MAESYNLTNIRTLLTEGFTGEELRRMCYDVPDFRPVYNNLVQSTGKSMIIDMIIEHAEQKLLMEELLDWARECNPNRYDRHKPYYAYAAPAAPLPPPPAESRSYTSLRPPGPQAPLPDLLENPSVVIDYGRCIGSLDCVEVCPVEALAEGADGRAVVVDPDLCIGCGACEPECPQGAITVF